MRTFFAAVAIVFCAATVSLAADTSTETKPADTTKSITDTNPVADSTTKADAQATETKPTDDADKPTVEFDDQTLTLAFEGNSSGELLKEYIPAGETLEKWTKLAATRQYADIDKPRAIAAVLKQQLAEQYPDSNCTLTDNAEDNSAIVDFVLWAPDKSFAEFNVFKYTRTADGGVLAEQYALRDYKNPQKFVEELKTTRDRIIKEMTEDGLQVDE